MTKQIPGVDKNLQNVVKELKKPDLSAHGNQQVNQQHMDQVNIDSLHHSKKFYEDEQQE